MPAGFQPADIKLYWLLGKWKTEITFKYMFYVKSEKADQMFFHSLLNSEKWKLLMYWRKKKMWYVYVKKGRKEESPKLS